MTDAREIVAIVHSKEDFDVVTNGAEADQGLWPAGIESYRADMACGAFRQGLLGPAYSDSQSGGAATEDPD